MEDRTSFADLVAHVERLDARLDVLEARAGVAAPTRTLPPPPTAASRGVPIAPTSGGAWQALPRPPAPAEVVDRPTSLNGESFLKWAGVGLVFLAMIFLVSTAVQRGWIGPELQLAGAVAVGLAMTGVSLKLRESRDRWALALAHGGVAVLASAAAAGHRGLELYSASAAAIALVVVVAIGWWLATAIGRASLAALAVGVGVILPVASDAADVQPLWVWSSWYAVVVVGGLALAAFRNWISLRLITIALTVVPLFAVTDEARREVDRLDLPITWIAVVVALAAYWLATISPTDESSVAVAASDDSAEPAGFVMSDFNWVLQGLSDRFAIGLPIVAWMATGQLFASESDNGTWWWAITVAAMSAVVAVAAYSIGRLRSVTFAAHLIGASVLLTIGFAGLLGGSALLVAVVAQAVGIGWLAYRTRDPLALLNAGALGLIGAALTTHGLIEAIGHGAPAIDDLVHLAVILIAAGVAWFGRPSDWSSAIGAAAWVGALAWIASILSQLEQGQVAVSILWALMGAVALMAGLSRRHASVANVGLVTLVITVAKLLTVDLDAVDTMWRAGLFFVVGLGLLKLGLTIADLDKDDQEDPELPGAVGPQPSQL